jgi:hypothetical protein
MSDACGANRVIIAPEAMSDACGANRVIIAPEARSSRRPVRTGGEEVR